MSTIAGKTIQASVAQQRRRAEDLFDQLARCSQRARGITRDTYGPGENAAHEIFRAHGSDLGLDLRRDFAANSYATWRGSDLGLPCLIVGSHLDSVPHGGNFDGAAGVVAGLVAVAALKELGVAPRRDITVMGIRAEESVWFQVSYIGSRSALGTLPPSALETRRIDTGRTLAEHISDAGGDPTGIREGRHEIAPTSVHAYVEVHIEQAPSLVELGKPIAICSGIPGNFRYPDARIVGRYDHVGTPRRFRRDAATAAADFAVALDALWQEYEAAGITMAATLGRFHTDATGHGMTTVAGEFRFSLDVRAYDAAVLARLEARLATIVREIEAKRGVRFELGPRAAAEVGVVSPTIKSELERTAADLAIPAATLGSPASHDAAAFASAGVPTAMIFVRNANGSHNPDEHMEIDDFLDACAVLATWMAAQAG
ncbi:MAG TPA: hydantoinase/carbamoylase family amidase [Hyphomicrobiaceae bacterium]|nr:hydantoinase/carbamoylase family amidase [Hyphomicrobiaceae bacterium]